MASIYVITNDVNGKQYVGKTLKDISERFREHINDSRRERCEKRPLYEAIRKYGEKHFSFRVLEENVDPEVLSEREMYWIKELGTYGHGGYNMTYGGDGKQLYDYNQIKELLLQGYTNKESASIIGCSIDTVQAVRKFYRMKRGTDNLKKPIDQLDLNGNLLRTFDGTVDAGKWLNENGYSKGDPTGGLWYCLKGIRKLAYGFKWRYHNESDHPSH